MNAKPRVSVIIVNWNGAKHLRLCLPSLASQSFESLEIIVVDNRSSDDSAEVARSFGVRWLPLEINLGLAPALNRGATIANGDLLLFVNNDMRFDPKFVAALVEALERDDEIFASDGMQFNWDGTVRGHLAARLTNVAPRRDSSTELVPGLYFYQQEKTEESSVFMASAACKLLPARYAVRTWLVSMAGLAKDIGGLKWKFAVDRLGVLYQMAGLVGQLLREKRTLFRNARSSPGKQLEIFLRLTDDDVRADRCN